MPVPKKEDKREERLDVHKLVIDELLDAEKFGGMNKRGATQQF